MAIKKTSKKKSKVYSFTFVIHCDKRIVVISDLHCGHGVGLTPRTFSAEVVQGYEHLRTKRTKWARIRKECWKRYAAEIEKLQPVDLLVVNGDCIEGRGEKSGSTELITVDRSEQCDIAIACIKAVRSKQIVMTYGTAYHAGHQEDWENSIAEKLAADGTPTKIGSHEWIEANGVVMDFKHHTTRSAVPHGRHTAVARERLHNVLWAEHDEQPKADIIIRSHVHYATYCGEPGRWMACTTPALQAMGSKYGGRVCSGHVDWGFYHFDITPSGEWYFHPHLVPIVSQRAKATVI